MQGSEAVTRIKEGLGFLSGSHHDNRIIARLNEAQREFEKGKSLPKFLLQQDQTLSLAAGASSIALPTGFLRVYDDEKPHYLPTNSTIPVFLARRYFTDAALAYQQYQSGSITVTSRAPEVYVIRKSTIDFIAPANAAYTITWSYFKADDAIVSGAENEWLLNVPELMVGEAGLRMARDARDGDAIAIFKDMREMAYRSFLSEMSLEELTDGPLEMGANL